MTFPPGTAVMISDFEPGIYRVCHDRPEDVPAFYRDQVHVWTSRDGQVYEAWVDPARLTAVDTATIPNRKDATDGRV